VTYVRRPASVSVHRRRFPNERDYAPHVDVQALDVPEIQDQGPDTMRKDSEIGVDTSSSASPIDTVNTQNGVQGVKSAERVMVPKSRRPNGSFYVH